MRVNRLPRLLDPLVDPVLALAVFAGGSYEIWAEAGQVVGSRPGNAAFLVLVSAPLVWRRRRPLPVLAVVTVASIVWGYAWYLDDQPPFAPFVAVLLCTYAVAATADGTELLLGAVLVGAFIVSDLVAIVAGGRP